MKNLIITLLLLCMSFTMFSQNIFTYRAFAASAMENHIWSDPEPSSALIVINLNTHQITIHEGFDIHRYHIVGITTERRENEIVIDFKVVSTGREFSMLLIYLPDATFISFHLFPGYVILWEVRLVETQN